jgi:peroxiredoxin Q/BCP
MLGKPVAGFILASTGSKTFRLSEQRGTRLVLYFYPKDDTPGCTAQGAGFRDHYREFKRLGCERVGVSRDPLASHERFGTKMGFPFELLSDPEEKVCAQLGVMKQKNMYGKKVRGIERSTFLIDEAGKLAREWRGVKVPGHVEEVLSFVKAL